MQYHGVVIDEIFKKYNPPKVDTAGKKVYVCSICGYVYDPAENNGVAFEDLPADWKCPRCKQSKDKFNQA